MRFFMQNKNTPKQLKPYGNNPTAGHYVKSVDANIYYEIYGAGEPIVLLHGGVYGCITELGAFIDSLSKRFQVIAISTRGHGKSEIGNQPLTLDQRANDALAVINQVTNKKVIMLGFSDGGYTAYKLAALYPARVKKIIAIGAAILSPGSRDFSFNVQKAIELDTAYWRQQLSLMSEPARLKDVFKQVEICYSKLTVGVELLGAIKCPVLLMAGDSDAGNSVQNMLNTAQLIADHQLAIIPHAGHPAFVDNFAAAWACIYPFINE
jgi:pimeloyl-ACP methyl ester carboxylesterase